VSTDNIASVDQAPPRSVLIWLDLMDEPSTLLHSLDALAPRALVTIWRGT
jgi:hypothetical protein